MTDDDGCKDIDECEAVPCEENQYCMNTEGSYACATCHKACLGCSGYGADKCDACKEGYRKPEETNNCIGKGFFLCFHFVWVGKIGLFLSMYVSVQTFCGTHKPI